MSLKYYKPTTPTRRHTIKIDYVKDNVWRGSSLKSLTSNLPKKTGRNHGLISSYHRGGGPKKLLGPVYLMRYNDEGLLNRKKISLKKFASKGSKRNPYLRNGDIIFVDKSLIGSTSEVITEITSPFTSLIAPYSFYKLLFD